MSLSLRTNIRSLFDRRPAANAPPAKSPAKATQKISSFQSSLNEHYAIRDDGVEQLQHYDLPRLIDILRFNRCADGPGITVFLNKYLPEGRFVRDGYGNRFLTINQKDGSAPRICFTSHCDTVSNDTKALRHPLCYNAQKDILFRKNGECLGADDGTGVWLMLNMIEAGVPGLYAFFLDEESGRQGSTWSEMYDPERYEEIDTFISFDRKNTGDIIATQSGDECCSTEFQKALADLLSSETYKLAYKPGATGSFTDSASFMDDWEECTNVSIGYDLQHTPKETQLVGFAARLCRTLCIVGHVFHDSLPVVRDPSTKPLPKYPQYGGYGGDYHGYGLSRREEAELDAWATANGYYGDVPDDNDPLGHITDLELEVMQEGDMEDILTYFPDATAAMLEEFGFTTTEVANYVGSTYFGIKDIRSADTHEKNR